MARSWIKNLSPKVQKIPSYLKFVVSGGIYKNSSFRGDTVLSDIKTQIEVMRTLAQDSQISTVLSYYATDSTVPNSSGKILWANASPDAPKELQSILDDLLIRWDVDSYARDHILELATVGNLYIPSTIFYGTNNDSSSRNKVALDNNTIPDIQYDIIPSTKILPENVIHLYKQGIPYGYMYQESGRISELVQFPESAIIHFSLGGLLGDYKLTLKNSDGEDEEYDVKFAQPLLQRAVQPTQALSLLENAVLLNSLIQSVKFINVDCGNAEEVEIRDTLQQIKDVIEQQLSLNTSSGDTQSFVNPQSPNNLVYLPKVNGQDAISITDLDMKDTSEGSSKLLDYYQNKKLSTTGVPKEQLNFSSNEGLGGAGTVASQRSAIYANALQRLTSAYISGWTTAINNYFTIRGYKQFVNKFTLHMSPIITPLSSVNFERKDSTINQASSFLELLESLGVTDDKVIKSAMKNILIDGFPEISSNVSQWDIDTSKGEEEGMM